VLLHGVPRPNGNVVENAKSLANQDEHKDITDDPQD
jgi:hypothetical protein